MSKNILTRPYKRKESDLRKALKKLWQSWGMFVQNIESGSVELGIPDCFVSYARGFAWIELKSIAAPARKTTLITPGLSDEQIAWALKFKKNKTLVGAWFLVVQVGEELFYSTVPRKKYKRTELKKWDNFLKELN